jgi:DNA modification methylase
MLVDDQAVHRWYRFVLSFPPHLVRDYLEKFGAQPGCKVLDPFCGTGTTIVEAKKLGMVGIGIEANPMAALASTVKTDWGVSPIDLLRQKEIVSDIYMKSLHEKFHSIKTAKDGLINEQISLFGLRGLDSNQISLILKGSMSPLPMHRTLVLLEAIERSTDPTLMHLKLALAWSVVNEIGNLRFGPEVGISKPKLDFDVLSSWEKQVGKISEDLELMSCQPSLGARVFHDDSREASRLIEANSIDFVITSPPYPNEKDYTRTTRLESVILGLINDKEELRRVKKGLVRSNTRSVYVDDVDHLEVEGFESIQELAREIEARRIALGKTSGFERLYHKVTKSYFGGMKRHLDSMKHVLKPGAKLAYVVGDQASYLQVMIRTGNIVAELAEACGYKVDSIDLFRTRQATATKQQLREEVVVLTWPGQK